MQTHMGQKHTKISILATFVFFFFLFFGIIFWDTFSNLIFFIILVLPISAVILVQNVFSSSVEYKVFIRQHRDAPKYEQGGPKVYRNLF